MTRRRVLPFEWREAICIAVFWFAFGVMFGIGITT